ncbi:hypothetical protein ABH924_004738 [Arthrobacter sp. GAS37]
MACSVLRKGCQRERKRPSRLNNLDGTLTVPQYDMLRSCAETVTRSLSLRACQREGLVFHADFCFASRTSTPELPRNLQRSKFQRLIPA